MDSREYELHQLMEMIYLLRQHDNRSKNREDVSIEKVIDYFYASESSAMLENFFLENPLLLTQIGKKEFEDLHKNRIRSMCAHKWFHKGYYEYIYDMYHQWKKAVQNNNVRDFFPCLDQHRNFFREVYKTYYGVDQISYNSIFKNNGTLKYYIALTTEAEYYYKRLSQLYEKINKNYHKCDYLLKKLSDSERKYIYQKVSDLLCSELGILPIRVRLDNDADVEKKKEKEISISASVTITRGIRQVLINLAHKLVPYLRTSSFYSQYVEMYFSLLPFISQEFIQKVAEILFPFAKPSVKKKELKKFLIEWFSECYQNSVGYANLNPLNELLMDQLEMTIEAKWFDKQIPTDELAYQWQEGMKIGVGNSPKHHIEGTLRTSHWIEGDFGRSFYKVYMMGYLLSTHMNKKPGIFDKELKKVLQTVDEGNTETMLIDFPIIYLKDILLFFLHWYSNISDNIV